MRRHVTHLDPSSAVTETGSGAFQYRRGVLLCDEVSLAEIAASVGTPFYVYSARTITDRYRALDRAFGGYPHTLHYALKANSILSIVRLLRGLGAGADANSGGEIEVALRGGFIPAQIVFTGVGKTHDELERAVALGVKAINAESPGELDRIDAIARAQGTRARVALRVNPDVDAQSHPHISTGLKTNKFGIAISDARAVALEATRRSALELVGVHVHIGSQIVNLDPLRRASGALVGLARGLRQAGIRLEHVDLGGGLGISYNGAPAPDAEAYASALLPALSGLDLELILEPGRFLLGPAGALVGRVVDTKTHPDGHRFAVLDAGMTELMRPALYGAFHRIAPVRPRPGAEVSCDVVGPLCESSDTLGVDRRLPPLEVGDLLAVLDAGAYGSVMASNYNRRAMPAEVLVEDDRWRVIRRRQTIDDLLSCEE